MRRGRACLPVRTDGSRFLCRLLHPVHSLRHAVRALAGCACLLALAVPGWAQTPAPPTTSGPTVSNRNFMIRGSLRLASNNQAVEMIKVELKKFTGETVSTTFTRSNGDFEFNSLSSGNYVVIVQEDGFDPIREQVELRNTARVSVYLYLREPVKLGEKGPEGPTISARELALPSKAADELQKGKEELFTKRNPQESLKHFQKLAKAAPDFYEADYYAGLAYSEMGQLADAEAALRKAIAASSDTHAPSFLSLASLLCNVQRFAEAESAARKGSELDPEAWQGPFEIARALLGMERHEEALAAAHAAREKRPDFPDLQLLLANIHIRRGDPYGLLSALDEYLKLRPEGAASERVRTTRRQLLEDMRRARAGQQAQPTSQPPPSPQPPE